MSNEAGLYTNAEIAAKAGRSRQAVSRALIETPATSRKEAGGRLVPAWAQGQLPEKVNAWLLAEAMHLGIAVETHLQRDCRTVEKRSWEPALPLSEIAQESIDKAVKLQRALAPTFARLKDAMLTSAERDELGVKDYAAVFGHEITPRYFRELLKRTTDRDGHAQNWARLEIYLEQHPKRKPTPKTFSVMEEGEFAELHDFIMLCRNPSEPTGDEQAMVWGRVLEVYDGLPKKARRRLLRFLCRHAPSLAATQEAMRVALHRRYERWLKNDKRAGSMRDGRRLKKGEERVSYPQDYVDEIAHRANAKYRGRMAPAKRDIDERLGIVTQTAESKSYIPESLRSRLRPLVEMTAPFYQGKQALDAVRPSLDRRYDRMPSGHCFQGDDFTLPVYWRVPDGKGWWKLVRGQCLIMIDFRSLRVLGFSLQPDKNYNCLVIRSLITFVCSEFFLPNKFYFERNIWERSKIIVGDRSVSADLPFSTPEVELGLRALGVKFKFAHIHRAKLVERVGGLLQDLMGDEPGYCGRDERRDCPDDTRKAILDLDAKRPGSLQRFYTPDDWQQRLTEIVQQYNATQQQGKVINGLSPDQAFEQFRDRNNPPITFDASSRFLLASHRRVVQIKHSGITLQFGKHKFRYFGEETARRIGQQMLAWFDSQNTDVLTVTDMNMRNPFTVERAGSVEADTDLAEDPEEYAREAARIDAHMAYGKARFVAFKQKFGEPRRNVIASGTAQLGAEFDRQKAEVRERRAKRVVTAEAAEKAGRRIGLPSNVRKNIDTPDKVKAAQRIAELDEQFERAEAQSSERSE
jgi:hypothetical protein